MSARARLALTTGLIVLLMLAAFEALFYVDVLRSEVPSVESLIAARAPRALLLGASAAALATLLAAWWGSRVLRGLTSVVSMAADLTERGDFSQRLAESARDRETEELARTFNRLVRRIERLLSTQRQLVADTAHELRTPLTTISGNLTLLSRALPEPDRREILADTCQEVERMVRLVEDLLLLADAGTTVHPERRPVRLDILTREVVHHLRHAQAERVEVTAEPVIVPGDEDRLAQVVRNLLSNALRYASTRPGAIRVRVWQSGQEANVSVEDDGPGLPADALERIFDRFVRLDGSRSRARGGTGLGLAIVRHVAEAHGGRAWAISQPGAGACFRVALPLEPSWAASTVPCGSVRRAALDLPLPRGSQADQRVSHLDSDDDHSQRSDPQHAR